MDDADHAGELEQADRERALRRSLAAPAPIVPAVEDGERVCLDCAEPIPPMRLLIVPGAVRCHACQSIVERSPR